MAGIKTIKVLFLSITCAKKRQPPYNIGIFQFLCVFFQGLPQTFLHILFLPAAQWAQIEKILK